MLFTSFMMGEVASSSLFHGMAAKTSHPLFREAFRHVGRDEARHLQICMALLEKDWPGLGDELKPLVTRQLRAGFVFLSMVLWEPPGQFWDLPEYFLANHRTLIDIARAAGLGCPFLRRTGGQLAAGDGAGGEAGKPLGNRVPRHPGT